MKVLISAFIILFCFSINSRSQVLLPEAVSFAYLGEAFTHPGIKIGIQYDLKKWSATISDRKNNEVLHKSFQLNPTIGTYYHSGYQTGVFLLPELAYARLNERGNYCILGVGAGYLKTYIPDVYQQSTTGEIERIKENNNYFISSGFIEFGKNLQKAPLSLYIKPQYMHALPEVPGGVGYFMLELGVKFNL